MNDWMSKILLSKDDAQEKESLEAWRDQMSANLFNMKESIDQERTMDQLKGYKSVDTVAAWDKISSTTVQESTKVNYIKIMAKAAAVMALVIAAWFVVGPSTNVTEAQQYTYNEAKEIILKDKTKVQLHAQSILTDLGNRKTKLTGRAFFQVTKDAQHPFEIALHHGNIIVLGTAFDIITNEIYTQIYVTEGKVKFNRGGDSYILTVGDILTIDNKGVQQANQPKIQATAWQNQKLVFQNESIVNVLYSVASYYQMKLKFESSTDRVEDKCKINSTYSKETLLQILDELSTIAGLRYTIEDRNTIVIQSFKC